MSSSSDGWDPRLEPLLLATPPESRSGTNELIYTGTLWKTYGHDPGPFFERLRRLRAELPRLSKRIELVIAGPLSQTERARLAAYRLEETVRHVGVLPRLDAVALQRCADAVVLFGSRHRDIVGGKLCDTSLRNGRSSPAPTTARRLR